MSLALCLDGYGVVGPSDNPRVVPRLFLGDTSPMPFHSYAIQRDPGGQNPIKNHVNTEAWASALRIRGAGTEGPHRIALPWEPQQLQREHLAPQRRGAHKRQCSHRGGSALRPVSVAPRSTPHNTPEHTSIAGSMFLHVYWLGGTALFRWSLFPSAGRYVGSGAKGSIPWAV